jgi:hypothetical protein
MPKLEEWSIYSDDSNPFQAPELRPMRMSGTVYDRDGFEDETRITTSSLQKIDLINNIVETRNTVYELGNPSAKYVKWLEDNGKKLEDYNTVQVTEDY